jgi:membrane protease YdiL (CAAX protease family)
LPALGFRGFAPWPTAVLFVGGCAAVFAFGLLYSQLHIPTNADRLAQQAAQAPYSTAAALVVAVVVAPGCEEVFFRGFVFGGSLGRMPIWAAAVASAVLWGTAHVDPGSFAPLVVLGLVLAGLRWRSRSLWPGIALHTLNNGVAAVFILSAVHR